jgi:uncharacterized protein
MNRFLGMLASKLVRVYQLFISPLMPPSCRFYPTCSEYSRICFERHGFLKGFYLTVMRLLRCNPWTDGGFDPVPPIKGKSTDDLPFYQERDREREESRNHLKH